MFAFHMRCRNIHLWLNRIDDDGLRDGVRNFVGRTENFRLIELADELGPEIWEIQKALDDLFRSGGTYSRELTAVDGNWYRSIVDEQPSKSKA